MTHNLETLGGIHKKNGKLLETSLLKNCGKELGEFVPKVTTGKHRFTTSKES